MKDEIYWIGFDFDGTLSFHNHEDKELEGKPTALINLLRDYQNEHKIKILTARPKKEWGIIRKFLSENNLGDLEITNKKDPGMRLLYDDRAVTVIRNTGVPLENILNEIINLTLEENHFEGRRKIAALCSATLICLSQQLQKK